MRKQTEIMNELNLIPCPKELIPTEAEFSFHTVKEIRYSGAHDAAYEALNERFSEIEITYEENGYYVELSGGKHLSPKKCPDKPDAYTLSVTEDGVRIDANTETGLFYGIQTLLQFPDHVPGLMITDYASIPMRMIHWDLKGYITHFDVLMEELKILATYKINAVLLEVEDKYDFKTAPGVGVQGAYTYEEMRTLSKYAKKLHIQIVPKLQCIAHADYILKHEAYKHLRENGHVYEYCATDQEAQKLWEAMCLELMDCFAEHKSYFHIGADESAFAAECPECGKLGKAKAYANKVSTCIDFVNRQKWTPVMWDDIIRNERKTFTAEEEQEIRECLGGNAIIMYWSYWEYKFPYIEEFQSAGMQVWGASGYSGCESWAGSVSPMAKRAPNIDAWTRRAIERNIECVCATGWTRTGSADCPSTPQEGSWFTILYAAFSMWSGECYDYKEFINKLAQRFYGTDLKRKLVDAILDIEQSPYDFTEAEKIQSENVRLQFLRYGAAMESFVEYLLKRLVKQFQFYEGKLGNKFEDHRRRDWLNYTRDELPVSIARYKKEIQEYYSVFYKEVTVEEIIRTRFGFLEKFVAEYARILEETQDF